MKSAKAQIAKLKRQIAAMRKAMVIYSGMPANAICSRSGSMPKGVPAPLRSVIAQVCDGHPGRPKTPLIIRGKAKRGKAKHRRPTTSAWSRPRKSSRVSW